MSIRGYALWILLGAVIAAAFLIGSGKWANTPLPGPPAEMSAPPNPKNELTGAPWKRRPQPCRVPKSRENLTEEAWKAVEDLADPCG